MVKKRSSVKILFILLLFSILLSAAKCGSGNTNQCNDDIDNDNDGYVDYPDDPGCVALSGTNENNQNLGCCEVLYANGSTQFCLDNSLIANCDDNLNYNFYGDNTCNDAQCGFTTTTTSTSITTTTSILINTCTDSDGGFNIFVEGNVTGVNVTTGNYVNYDNCIIVGDTHYLREWGCIGDLAGANVSLCSNGCTMFGLQGRCNL